MSDEFLTSLADNEVSIALAGFKRKNTTQRSIEVKTSVIKCTVELI